MSVLVLVACLIAIFIIATAVADFLEHLIRGLCRWYYDRKEKRGH